MWDGPRDSRGAAAATATRESAAARVAVNFIVWAGRCGRDGWGEMPWWTASGAPLIRRTPATSTICLHHHRESVSPVSEHLLPTQLHAHGDCTHAVAAQTSPEAAQNQEERRGCTGAQKRDTGWGRQTGTRAAVVVSGGGPWQEQPEKPEADAEPFFSLACIFLPGLSRSIFQFRRPKASIPRLKFILDVRAGGR